MKVNKRLIKCLSLFILAVVLVQCDLGNLLKPLESVGTSSGGTSSYKYSIYNPDGNAHIASSYYTSYPVTITSKYLFNKDYVWFATIANVRYLYQFTTFNGMPNVYSAYASSILKYERWQIYEDRKLMPTTIYTNTVGEWFMSFSPIFYEYKDEYAMNTNFNYNSKNNMLFTNIKPASKPIALKSEYLKVAVDKGNIVSSVLDKYQIEKKLINTEWYTMEIDYSRRLTIGEPSYQFLQNNILKYSTGADEPSGATNAISKGWAIWQAPTSELNSYLNYVYIYDIKNIKIFLNYPAGTDFSTNTVNTNLDVLMLWYDPSNLSVPSAGPFTRYTLDKD